VLSASNNENDCVTLSISEQILLSSFLPTEASRARLRELVAAHSRQIDWPKLAQRAEFNYLAPLLRFNLAQIGVLGGLPDEAQERLAMGSQVWAARELACVSEAERLLDALQAGGVTALPLKGAALLLANYYPQAGLRPALDLDLLVDPARIELAESIAQDCGYALEPGRTKARARQRLANELNHVAPRRGASGLLLELHTRAFHYVRAGRDFGLAEMRERAQSGQRWLLPAPEDLALHLAHHTLVDLQSTRAILRTLADWHFIFAREPQALPRFRACAAEFGFGGVVETALAAWHLLAAGRLEEVVSDERLALLLETALLEEPPPLADAARLFEYLDFSRQPLAKLSNLVSLVFTNREHLEQLYGERSQAKYWRRPFDLLCKFNWKSLQPRQLRRVWRLRKLAARG
jgi:hypothetical protein